jgi:hypothetical protein
MQTFLQVLGITFLVILCLIGLAVVWLAWKAWGLWRQFQLLTKSLGALSAGSVPPFRVKLEKVERPTWADRDQIEYLAGPLRKAGFVDLGIFDVTPSQFRLLALASERDSVYAAIYQHPDSGVHLDLVTAYADGTQCTYSTAKQAGLLDQPEFKTTRSLPESDAGELLARFLAERPQKAMVTATAEAFPQRFEESWAREFDWRIARGGMTEEEIRRAAAQSGGKASEEDVRFIRHQWRQEINAHYHVALQENFLASGNVSAGQWERIRDRVHFIHDDLEWDEMIETCGLGMYNCGPDDEHSEMVSAEADRLAAAFPPREAFARINELLKPEQRFEKLGELAEPVAATVYLAPEYRVPSVYDDEE